MGNCHCSKKKREMAYITNPNDMDPRKNKSKLSNSKEKLSPNSQKLQKNSTIDKTKKEAQVKISASLGTSLKRNKIEKDKPIEDFLNDNTKSANEKLRKTLDFLNESGDFEYIKANNDENEIVNELKTRFVIPLERNLKKLYNIFQNEKKQGYRPAIKILQVLDLLFQNIEWNETEMQVKDKVISSVYSLFEKTIETNLDWRILRKMNDQNKKTKEKLEFKNKLTNGFMSRLKIIKNALLWKKESETTNLIEKIIDFLENKSKTDPKCFENSLIRGRFEKTERHSEMGSLIVGDEGGVYLLMNSFDEKSLGQNIALESGLSLEFLKEKRKENNKIILGKGAFGKVRLALSIFGNENVDIGQLVCVKKSIEISSKKKKFE